MHFHCKYVLMMVCFCLISRMYANKMTLFAVAIINFTYYQSRLNEEGSVVLCVSPAVSLGDKTFRFYYY